MNMAFKNMNIMINIVPVKKTATVVEDSRVKDLNIVRERNLICEAHIVRQMKTNKTMQFLDL